MGAICLQAENLTKSYGQKSARQDALRGVSVLVEQGEFLAIRGPSGCGKSTLLHILGAMDRPTGGSVLLHGRRLDTLGPDELAVVRRKHVGFVFQAFNLLPTLNVQENVSLPLLLEGLAESESLERSRLALADVGLESRGRGFPSQLSGGEMQRVAIARALAIRPELIIADEPTGSLDSVNGQRILQLLAQLNASKQITVLMATHSEEASKYASRIIYLRDGQLDEEVGSGALSKTL